jgi:transmembrane sensor
MHLKISTMMILRKMRQIENINTIDAVAAQWAARVDRHALSADERASFYSWLAADRRHLGAFARMQAILASTERAAALSGMEVVAQPLPVKRVAAMVAAALLLVISAAGIYQANGPWQDNYRAFKQARAGQVDLPDGSRIALIDQARATTSFDSRSRIVRLIGGEAMFSVAKDPLRPFTVIAGGVRVTAIGTKFSVSRKNGRVAVHVIEGIVSIVSQGGRASQRLVANQSAAFDLAAETSAFAAETDDFNVAAPRRPALAQTRIEANPAMLTFEAEPLGRAAQQFNAANDKKDLVVDPALAAKPITGLFASSDPEGFARAVALSLEANMVVEGDDILIVP